MMTLSCSEIGTLVTRIQSDFLTAPLLTMTVPQAQQRYEVSSPVCEALLDALADARVLVRSPEGIYMRWFPGRHSRYSPTGYHAA